MANTKAGGQRTAILAILPFVLLGGGAAGGYQAGGMIGAAVGAGAGLILLIVAYQLISRTGKEMPGCRCGESKHEELEYKRSKKWGFVYRCDKCKRSYMLINEITWDEITDDGNRVPYKEKGPFGWKDALPAG